MYDYLYYKLVKWHQSSKHNDSPKLTAMYFLSVCQFTNLLLISLILEFFTDISLADYLSINVSIGAAILIGVFNYFYLVKRYDKIANKYGNESRNKKIIGNFLLAFYIIGSFYLFAQLLIYLGHGYW